jgi:exo-beta-1,3-glucanase (GH17 family)
MQSLSPLLQRSEHSARWLIVAALLALLAWWWWQGQASPLPASTAAQAQCVSYAPFRRHEHTPFRPEGRVSATHIEQDLRLLLPFTRCIRTYGVSQGLEQVPEVAQTLGMRVHLGVWISADHRQNRVELDRAIALSLAHPETVRTLIVGNEVMLRKELKQSELASLLQEARTRTRTPVTYADVWEFWLQNATLKAHVDLVTVHILPYWEDQPVAADKAVEHLDAVLQRLRFVFGAKPIWVGETGWPAQGRQRAGARPGVVEQAQVVRETLSYANSQKLNVNIIEAFDQHWKRALEGGMGANWGLFRADGTQRVRLEGAVVPDANWQRGYLGALAGAVFGLMLTFNRRPAIALVAFFAFTGALAPLVWDFLTLWSRSPREWLGSSAAIAALLLYCIALLRWPTAKLTAWLQLLALLVSASWALILWADPRYRGFPIAIFLPIAVLSIGFRFQPTSALMAARAQWLAMALIASALAVALQEGWNNTQALVLATCWGATALGALLGNTSKDAPATSTAGADNSAL